ncbi:MAG: bifunctional precorrin-2 dehydrogenase/sirohydrochlorin ferrochelatase [Desulfohalobiaceae bacterium]|nr:bifunctional precorrin-2 dehydrogenase/sirohydrochlorin ferrochelatase [Desulfohalobiaceae bacterium]
MHYFPVSLDLRDRKCLVAGAGEVGLRKIQRLIDAEPAEILVVEPLPDPGLEAVAEKTGNLRLARRPFWPEDLEDRFLVIASTGDPRVNREISRLCREKNILCNIVDQPELCSFILPALFRRGDLSLAVSTGGASPALARRVRERLEDCFGPEYAGLARLLRRLRPMILELGMDGERNKAVFRSLCRDDVLQALQEEDRNLLRRLLQSRLPRQLHSEIRTVLDELF